MSGALLLPMWDCTQSLPMSLVQQTVRAWLPKADKQLVREITLQLLYSKNVQVSNTIFLNLNFYKRGVLFFSKNKNYVNEGY